MTYTEEMTTSEILLRLASIRNELLQAVNDIEKISKNICYKAEQTEPQIDGYMTAEQIEDYRKMLDKAEHKVYGNIEDEPQTEYDKYREKIRLHDSYKDWLEDRPQKETTKGLQLFADILFDKDKANQFLNECKTIDIEP